MTKLLVMPPGLDENCLVDNYPNHYVVQSGLQLNNNGLVKERSTSLRKFSHQGPNMDRRKSVTICGVTLMDDQGLGKSDKNFVLGTVCVEDERMKLEDLRKSLALEIPEIPESFVFVSKQGWPLCKKQECILRTDHILSENNTICIKKHFEKQKFGIVMTYGDPVGFVFADINSSLKQFREILEQQLKVSLQLKIEYRFIERNGWPVMQCQETILSVLDIVNGQVVQLQNCGKSMDYLTTKPVRPTSINFVTAKSPCETPTSITSDVVENEVVRRKKSFKFLSRPEGQTSTKSRKDSQKRTKIPKEDLNLSQPILISYARAEAAQYALQLKRELVSRGYSVYLDVHEIKTGSDWQDSLNFAVTHCFMFVPLITRMYGKTQWTNREIKLADVLGKIIVPVNFGEEWPPPCLAIQFATTQYIPWKTQENDQGKGELDKVSDPRNWSQTQLERVAKHITDCYKDHCGPLLRRQPSNKDLVLPRSRPYTLAVPRDENYRTPTTPYDEPFEEKKHVVVISAHPKQKLLAQELKDLFKAEGHLVWCSNNWQEGQEALNYDDRGFSLPNTPRDLPTIAEGEVFFGQHEQNVFYSTTGETRKWTSSFKESENYGRRPLSRLMSQFTDISQPSTLSQEKLDRLRIFQQKVDQAGVIVVLVSEDYFKSMFSQQQIFYCEQRKHVVLIKCDGCDIPQWFKLLMGNDMIKKIDNPQFECVLKARVKRALNPSSSETPKDATFEAKINYLVNYLKCNLPLQDTRVYITGSSKLQTQRAEDICKAVGRELSKVPNISLVTGGFYGVPDITAQSFSEQRECSTQSYAEDPAVVHILPIRETEDLKAKARQNPDGSFEVIPYGKTFFMGDTLKERETVVARLLDICIVIEGGPGVVHEVEEFIWNDHFVIPIHSTGGAAGGKYGVPMKIFELPQGVEMEDWAVLSDQNASPENVAKAVVNIIFSLKKAVASPSNTLKAPGFLLHKRKKKNKLQRTTALGKESIEDCPSKQAASTISRYSENNQQIYAHHKLTFKKKPWWRRIFSIFRRSKRK